MMSGGSTVLGKSHRTHLHEIPDYPLKNNYNGATPDPGLYFWMEPDSGWARSGPSTLLIFRNSPDVAFRCMSDYAAFASKESAIAWWLA